nr:uncharacterized protein CI109_002875 [Kwoniella shandongensis]KAA5528717.1 hypothetical protein CI109_002875 [Kwoniella shandongensis]
MHGSPSSPRQSSFKRAAIWVLERKAKLTSATTCAHPATDLPELCKCVAGEHDLFPGGIHTIRMTCLGEQEGGVAAQMTGIDEGRTPSAFVVTA